jgi:hypothetical protein
MERIDDIDGDAQAEASGGRVYCIHRVDYENAVHLAGSFDLGLAVRRAHNARD